MVIVCTGFVFFLRVLDSACLHALRSLDDVSDGQVHVALPPEA